MENKCVPKLKCPIVLATIILFMVLFMLNDDSYAGEWSFVPAIDLSESYDDNVRLAKEGNEEVDSITQVNPGFSLLGKGRHTELSLNYKMQNIFYRKNSEEDATYHNVQAENKNELIRDSLFLDANVNYSQRTINSESTASIDNSGINGNRSDVLGYSVTPYFIHSFGQSADLRVQHTYEEVDSKSEQLASTDTKTNTSNFILRSGPSFKRLNWRLSHQQQVTEYNERPDIESQDSQLTLQLFLSEKFYLVGVAGQEKYNYAPLPGQDEPEGSYWELGAGWTPSQRTRFEVRQGKHYYGDTKRLEFSHRTRQSTWAINYTEDITTTSRVQGTTDSVVVYQPDTGTRQDYSGIAYSNLAVVSINEVLSASIIKTTPRTELLIQYSGVKRKYLEMDGEENISSLNVNWKWQFASRTNLVLSTFMSKSEVSISENETTMKRHELRVNYDFSNNASTYFVYDNDSQQTDLSGYLYKRNIYKVGVEARF